MNKNEIKEYIANNFVNHRICNMCGSLVLKSTLENYKYQCMVCDVDLFEFETSVEILEDDRIILELLDIYDIMADFNE